MKRNRMSRQDTALSIIDEVVERVLGPYVWMRSFLLGEFEPEKDLSVLVAQALANFVPGLVIVFSARDAAAITIRMAKYPEKRDDPLEWIFLCACLIVIALPVAMAAGGAVLAGVGSVFGAALGSELGAALKAIVLLLMNKTANLADILMFLQKFMKGNLTGLLKQIKFKQFEDALVSTLKSILAKLIEICVGLRRHYAKHAHLHEVRNTIEKLRQWEASFYALQTAGIKNIPLALAELDARLAVVLTQVGVKEAQTATAGVKAVAPRPATIKPQRVYASVGGRGGEASGGKPPSPGSGSGHNHPPTKNKATTVTKAAEGPNSKRQTTADPVPGYGAKSAGSLERVLFENKFPSDKLGNPKIVPPQALKNMSGNLNYVVLDDGRLVIGKSPHTSLTNNKPVQAAGEIQLYNGKVIWLDNASGHYQPTGPNIQIIAESAFCRLGMDAAGKFQFKVWQSDASLARGGKWVKQ